MCILTVSLCVFITYYIDQLYFVELEVREITPCDCMPAALRLILHGLFPCAPNRPSLAVDVNMLQFVQELFVRSPPNQTAWCDTLEAFLDTRHYKLQTRVCAFRNFAI